MNLYTGVASDAYFGGSVPPAVRPLLEQAARAAREDVAALLWTAQAGAPRCLAIYHALYKHHAGRREFDLARRAAERGLAEAAAQAGLPADWREARPEALPPGLDFGRDGPARFWLFTLKALAFIALRDQRPEDARALLATLTRLDRDGQRIGDEVIAELLASVDAAPGAAGGAAEP